MLRRVCYSLTSSMIFDFQRSLEVSATCKDLDHTPSCIKTTRGCRRQRGYSFLDFAMKASRTRKEWSHIIFGLHAPLREPTFARLATGTFASTSRDGAPLALLAQAGLLQQLAHHDGLAILCFALCRRGCSGLLAELELPGVGH